MILLARQDLPQDLPLPPHVQKSAQHRNDARHAPQGRRRHYIFFNDFQKQNCTELREVSGPIPNSFPFFFLSEAPVLL
jgi:hypothetical protein